MCEYTNEHLISPSLVNRKYNLLQSNLALLNRVIINYKRFFKYSLMIYSIIIGNIYIFLFYSNEKVGNFSTLKSVSFKVVVIAFALFSKERVVMSIQNTQVYVHLKQWKIL